MHQFWLGACTGFNTVHYWLGFPKLLMFTSGLVTGNKLSSGEGGFAVVWKGKVLQNPRYLTKYVQGGQGVQAADGKRLQRIIFMFLFSHLVNIFKIFTFKKLMQHVQVFKLVLTELISVQGLIQFRALHRLMLSSSKLACRVFCSGAELFLVLIPNSNQGFETNKAVLFIFRL